MRKSKRGCLKSCSDQNKTHSKPDHLSSTENIANGEVDAASCERAKTVACDSDASDNRALILMLALDLSAMKRHLPVN